MIDLVGYRRHGHNEGDEPAYTQPMLYRKIADHPTVRTLWVERLIAEGVLTDDEAKAMADEVNAKLRASQDQVRSKDGTPPLRGADDRPRVEDSHPETSVALDALEELNSALLAVPEGFTVHPKLARQLSRREKDFGPDFQLEWAHAEALAFASLSQEGIPIRMTGQDSQRGTFSQRHLVLHDVETGATVTPVNEISETRVEISNSPLTEA
ncbi:MAG: 2-oxoglutarate dehydrogenase E1 component, partial [Thermoplasmata archaeon]|nr:2-oxoglutarate dehydrogenase E1 component [Thermoplasmata archaeon]